jgi:hypothetical protein
VRASARLQNVWRNVLTVFVPLSSSTEEKDTVLSYDEFRACKTFVSPDSFEEILKRLVNEGVLAVPDNPEVKIEGSFQSYFPQINYRSSNDAPIDLEWPGDFFVFQPDDTFKASPEARALLSLDQPLYDDGYGVILDLFGIDLHQSNAYTGTLLFYLPKYVARITNIHSRSRQLSLIVESNIDLNQLLVKLYCAAPPSSSYHYEGHFEKNELSIDLEFAPLFYLVYLLSTKTGEVLDYRRFDVRWQTLSKDIEFERTQENTEIIIQQGENELVEFKQEFTKNREEFVETAVAMSNAKGGTIFVGVSNNGSITGVTNQSTEDSILQSIRELSDPSILPKVDRIDIQGKEVLAVRIEEGQNKPYTLKNKGVFVRYGSTDRIAKRDELDQFYAAKYEISRLYP